MFKPIQPTAPGELDLSLVIAAANFTDFQILPGHVFSPGSQFLDHTGKLYLFQNGAVATQVTITRLSPTVLMVVMRITVEPCIRIVG